MFSPLFRQSFQYILNPTFHKIWVEDHIGERKRSRQAGSENVAGKQAQKTRPSAINATVQQSALRKPDKFSGNHETGLI